MTSNDFASLLNTSGSLVRTNRSAPRRFASASKEADAKRLGVERFVLTKDPEVFNKLAKSFDVIIDTVSAQHDLEPYFSTLKTDGVLVMVGLPPNPLPVSAFSLVPKRRSFVGSMIGGIPETQEMLDYCAEHNIVSDVEVIPIQQIDDAWERTIKGQVKYRFVIDIASLKE